MMHRVFRHLFLFCVSLGCFLVFSHITHAASLYITPGASNVLKGDTVTLQVRLDTDEGECVNTVDGSIAYGEGIQAVDVSRGRSILTLWVEEPTINKDERTITFAGGIPNGYCGRIPGDPSLTNVIAEIVFRSPGFSIGSTDTKSATISFKEETRVLLNDGTGEAAPLTTFPATIDLIQQVGTTTSDSWNAAIQSDETPPQPFAVELVQNPAVYSGKYYVVFNTTDKQSGVDHYEVMEESHDDFYAFKWGSADAPWRESESPYVLIDQNLQSVIHVKAIDKAGNERVTTFIPDEALRTMPREALIVWGALVFVAVLLGVGILYAFFILIRKWRARRHAAESSSLLDTTP